MNMQAIQWQKQRNFLNHDWLINQFLVKLDSVLKLLNDEIEDQYLLEHCVEELDKLWNQNQSDLSHLLYSLEDSLSPQKNIESSALKRLNQTKRTNYVRLLHNAWFKAQQVAEKKTKAEAAQQEASTAYYHWKKQVESLSDTKNIEQLMTIKKDFIHWRQAITDMSSALSQLPKELFI